MSADTLIVIGLGKPCHEIVTRDHITGFSKCICA